MSPFQAKDAAARPQWELRLLETAAEMAQAEQLQQVVWPGSDVSIVPGHLLLTAAHNGGLVAGAWAGERLIGFVFGFPGLEMHAGALRLKHCSHELGVHPEFRGGGVGFALKCFQRERVLAQGIEHITWTYDPLLAPNAHLNIARLGAVCNTYFRDMYGELRDGLNAGLPSDRLQVDWLLSSQHVISLVTGAGRPRGSLEARVAAGARLINPLASPGLPAHLPGSADLLVEIPADFAGLKALDQSLALRWRLATRGIFEELFSAGYHVIDFLSDRGQPRRTAYLFARFLPE